MKNTEKVNNWIKEISKETKGGNLFFDKIDDKIKSDKNIIIDLFTNINKDFGTNYNLVVSGEFGNLVFHLLRKDDIICKGSILLVSGGLTSHFNDMDKIKKIKEVRIIRKSGNIENKDFIFVDDSYYSGTTEFSINHFLKSYNSKIIKTYIVYDGNDKRDKDRISIYNYYDWNQGSERTFDELLKELHKYKVPYDYFENKIIKKEITSIIQLRKEINKFLKKIGEKEIDVYKRIRESTKIKRFSDINI